MEHRKIPEGTPIPTGLILNSLMQGALFAGNAHLFRIANPKSAALYSACKVLLLPIANLTFGTAGVRLSRFWLSSKQPELFAEINEKNSKKIFVELRRGMAWGMIGGSVFTVLASMTAATKFASPIGLNKVILLETIQMIELISGEIAYRKSGLDQAKMNFVRDRSPPA